MERSKSRCADRRSEVVKKSSEVETLCIDKNEETGVDLSYCNVQIHQETVQW